MPAHDQNPAHARDIHPDTPQRLRGFPAWTPVRPPERPAPAGGTSPDWDDLAPEQAPLHWPAERPLAALVSGADDAPARSRWSVLAASAAAPRAVARVEDLRAALGLGLRQPTSVSDAPPPQDAPPDVRAIVAIPYDLGAVIEPRASGWDRSPDRSSSLHTVNVLVADVGEHVPALVHDRSVHPSHQHDQSHQPTPRWWSRAGGETLPHPEPACAVWRAGEVRPALGSSRQAYERAVARALDYIRAGDVYQVNLAHPLEGAFTGSARALASRLLRAARPWYGAYLEPAGADRTALVSASPESFLTYDARTRRVETRPMKGTRAGAGDPRELERNDKERAELNMIVDLMRNDLGRVCELGSVRVEAPRDVEAHGASFSGAGASNAAGTPAPARTPGVLQATATVSGTLRAGLDLADLLWATFPPGSVTGAPKVRAMQIIAELEPAPRGHYCGAIGWVGADGSGAFSVAIRAAEIRGLAHAPALDSIQGALRAWVGAGIVADSLPHAEWEETLVKAWALRAAGLRIEA